eukprot:gene21806-28224_t
MAENCKILAKQFEAPIKATIAYCALYYFFLYFQAGVGHLQFYLAKKKAASEAKAKGEKNVEKVSYGKIKYGTQSHDKISLTAQRTVGNLMEQAIPFLTSLWITSIDSWLSYKVGQGAHTDTRTHPLDSSTTILDSEPTTSQPEHGHMPEA